MNTNTHIQRLMAIGLLAIFISACASTQEELNADGGPTSDDQLQIQPAISDGGADATGLTDSASDGATAIAGDGPLSPREALQLTEGPLSNRAIYFEFDSAKLSDESIAILEAHGNFVAGNGEVSIRLEGHTDERGSREYNIALGDRRAQSVRRIFLFQGASVDQVDTVSYGEEQPAMFGHDEDSWSKNRRVELIYQVN